MGTWMQSSLDITRIFTRKKKLGASIWREIFQGTGLTKIASILCGDFKGNWPLKRNRQVFIGCNRDLVLI